MPHPLLRVLPIAGIVLCLAGGPAVGALETPWWVVNGEAASDHVGWSVAGVPDLDGDGLGDVIVGVPDDDVDGLADAGTVHVYSGGDGHLLWSAHGDTAEDRFGQAVAGVSDLDEDGFGDVIVGAPMDDPRNQSAAGSVHVYSGATGTLLWTREGDSSFDVFGTAVAGVPDVNGDGFGDVVVGASDDRSGALPNSGTAYVYSGRTGVLLWKVGGTAAGDRLGTAVGGVPDVNGDGRGDVIIGVPDDDFPGKLNAGSVQVHSGRTGALLWSVAGPTAGGRFGAAVAGVQDLLGSGLHGFVVGAALDDPASRSDAGSVHAIAGTGTILWSVQGAFAHGHLGHSVAGGADVDADGFGDVVAGALLGKVSGVMVGTVHVYSGQDGTPLWQASGSTSRHEFGRSVAFVPDVDGDGRGDVVIGASGASRSGLSDVGEVRVYATQEATADVTPPVVTCPDDLGVEATGPAGAFVAFSVTATDDTDPAPTLTCEPASESLFPLGTTTVTCTATDISGNKSHCTFTVTVSDTTAPNVSCSVAATSLWAPNHEMRDVGLGITVSDEVDEDLTVTLAVHSDEAAAAGDADADFDGSSLLLRADRDGRGDGRVFLVVVTATDASGNTSASCCAVYVPKSMSASHRRSAASEAGDAVETTTESGGSPPAGYATILGETTLP